MKFALVSLPKNEFRYPPIGLLRIAAYVRAKMEEVEIKLIDNTFEDILEEIKRFNPDIIGMTTFTSYYQDAIEFTKKIKSMSKNVKVIIGGPHITTLPDSFDKCFDAGVIGEGEETIVRILEAIEHGRAFNKIKGVIYYKGSTLVINQGKKFSANLDELHKIDYRMLNKSYFKKKFLPEIGGYGVSMGMMTSIGCPYNCRFCSIKVCWDKIRFRNLDLVTEEIKDLYYNFGVRHIDFYDDLFSVNKARLREFRNKLKTAGLLKKLTFSCQARTNLIDDEMCKILNSLNVKTVVFGFESGSDKILRYIKNDLSLSVETNKKAVVLCVKHGLNVFGCLMMGMPNETLEDMQKTIDFIDFARKQGALRIWTQILVPLPGTEMWEIAKKSGRIKDKENDWRAINIHNQENPILLEKNIPYEKFLEKYRLAKKKCRYFVYKLMLKTLVENPLTIVYLIKESTYYLKRLTNFLKQ